MKEPITFENSVLKGTVFGERITAMFLGGPVEAVLAPWEEIRKLGFEPRDRAYGSLQDGTPALAFNRWDPEQHRDWWFVTTESLEDILGQKLRTTDDLANWMIGNRVLVLGGMFPVDGTITAILGVTEHEATFRCGGRRLRLKDTEMRDLVDKGTAETPRGRLVIS